MRAQWALAGPLQLSAFSYLVPFAVTSLVHLHFQSIKPYSSLKNQFKWHPSLKLIKYNLKAYHSQSSP